MSYFVTGATGFIGRNLVELLLEREGTDLRARARGLEGPARGASQPLGSRRGARRRPIVGDLSAARPRASRTRTSTSSGQGRPPLPPGRGLRHDGRRREPAASPTSRARGTWSSSPRRSRRAASTWSARSPPPASTRAPCARTCSRRPRTSTTPTSGPSTTPRASSAASARGPGASTGPGIVVGHSETGEMDKIDGPYYFFKLIQPAARRRARSGCRWSASRGGRSTSCPVDFVARAMDHIAHVDGLDGQGLPPDRPQPEDRGRGDQHLRARRRTRPQATMRIRPPDDRRHPERPASRRSRCCRRSKRITDQRARRLRHPALGAHLHQLPDAASTRARRRRALEGTGIRVPPLEAYADKLWDYWERNLDPDLFKDRTLWGPCAAGGGSSAGDPDRRAADPDELLRLAGGSRPVSLERPCAAGRHGHRRVVGIGKAAA